MWLVNRPTDEVTVASVDAMIALTGSDNTTLSLVILVNPLFVSSVEQTKDLANYWEQTLLAKYGITADFRAISKLKIKLAVRPEDARVSTDFVSQQIELDWCVCACVC